MSLGDTGLVHIWTSSGRGQDHRSKKGRKSLFPQCKTYMGSNSHFTVCPERKRPKCFL